MFGHGIRGQEIIKMDLLFVYPRNCISYRHEIFTQDAHQMPNGVRVKQQKSVILDLLSFASGRQIRLDLVSAPKLVNYISGFTVDL